MRKYKKCIVYVKKFSNFRYNTTKSAYIPCIIILNFEDHTIRRLFIEYNIRKHLSSSFIESLFSRSGDYYCLNGTYPKIVKRIKNYKRDWFKGDLENFIKEKFTDFIFLGGI